VTATADAKVHSAVTNREVLRRRPAAAAEPVWAEAAIARKGTAIIGIMAITETAPTRAEAAAAGRVVAAAVVGSGIESVVV
jgi:hypothetical protein